MAYDIDTLVQEFKQKGVNASPIYFVVAFFLMLANWALEALKWRYIISRYEPISLAVSIKAVLSGVTLSIITPNQIGDFIGRVLHLQVLNKIKGSLATVIGHTAQVLVTCLFGAYALIHFGHTVFKENWMIALLFAAIMLALLLYVGMGEWYAKLKKIAWLNKYQDYLVVFGDFSPQQLSGIFGISFLRYLVFLSQYFLLLRFYGIEIDAANAIACIVGTFFVQSLVPSFLLLEIGLRGASAIWFFELYTHDISGILLSAYSLWMINMLIPALLGLYFIYKVK